MLRLILWVLLLAAVPAYGEIYRYEDSEGTVHISDHPLSESDLSPEAVQKRFAEEARKEAQRMEKSLRSLAKRFSIRSYTTCSVSQGPPSHHPACKMTFPATHNMRQIHMIEAFVLQAAMQFARRDGAGDFELVAVMNGDGSKSAASMALKSDDFAPICGYAYYEQFDQLYPLGPSL